MKRDRVKYYLANLCDNPDKRESIESGIHVANAVGASLPFCKYDALSEHYETLTSFDANYMHHEQIHVPIIIHTLRMSLADCLRRLEEGGAADGLHQRKIHPMHHYALVKELADIRNQPTPAEFEEQPVKEWIDMAGNAMGLAAYQNQQEFFPALRSTIAGLQFGEHEGVKIAAYTVANICAGASAKMYSLIPQSILHDTQAIHILKVLKTLPTAVGRSHMKGRTAHILEFDSVLRELIMRELVEYTHCTIQPYRITEEGKEALGRIPQ